MKVMSMDPRTPLQLKPEHEATLDRQVNEVIEAMAATGAFVMKADEIRYRANEEINKLVEKITAEVKDESPLKKAERIELLEVEMASWEDSRRTPTQVMEEERVAIKAKAVGVLQVFHNEKMKGRLAQWLTTCRLDGCEKKPRSNKGHRNAFYFCKDHAGVRNEISKDEYRRLRTNAVLRVVA